MIISIDAGKTKFQDPISMATASVIRGNYKLHFYFGYTELPNNEPYYELYDLENDPEERMNLASNVKMREIKKELSAKVDAMMRGTGDRGIESERDALARYGVGE